MIPFVQIITKANYYESYNTLTLRTRIGNEKTFSRLKSSALVIEVLGVTELFEVRYERPL